MFQIIMSTDGACSGNPGPGGFAAILRCGDKTKEISGYESKTTNNRMELRAVIEGVMKLNKQCDILVRTDSQIVCNAIANLDTMPQNNWCKKTGAKRANVDLLQQLYNAKHAYDHVLRYQYVEGHSGDPDNERCDMLAKEQIVAHTR